MKMSMNTPPTATNVMIMQYPVTHMAHTRANVMLPLLKIEEETLKALLLFQLIVFSLMLPVTTSMVLKEDSLALLRTALKVTDSFVKMSMNTPPTATNVMTMQYPVTHMAHTRANVMLIALVPV